MHYEDERDKHPYRWDCHEERADMQKQGDCARSNRERENKASKTVAQRLL